MYDGYVFEVIVQKDGHYPRDHKYPPVPRDAVLGDCWHRFYVRMLEVVQAIRLVRQGLDRYPSTEGEFRVPYKMSAKLPVDECYLETECPRGQMGFYIVGDGDAARGQVVSDERCPQAGLIEALHDGRLGASEAASGAARTTKAPPRCEK